ncbi:hypothetical protein GQF61_04900 [Sphingobacterium sp. DK4209]|uniref:Outer membrane beta-barrel protein n=1 Tax=Sphingobacterium zhuxiongii TaxID=2662364 RepID=A0A5Q0QEE5_9SPHI|nr:MULTISPECIES: hypothetical protein [unclassified Sphingobacterium]MVZ65181.1 hypothetical protein [Sphingobacterium sp. DK4209]QGA26128.1 hypothetical protein GFH32_07230 [Sphingobacterium sp. dk4302]
MHLKKILSLGLISIPFLLNAQALKCPPVDAYGNANQKFDLTMGGGATWLYGDINHESNLGYAGVLKLDYKLYKGLYIGVEGQLGRLRSKGNDNPLDQDWDPRYVINQFYATGLINATVYPYRFFINERDLFRASGFEKYVLNGFHVSIGAGGIFNNYAKVNRNSTYRYRANDGSEIVQDIPPGTVNGPHEVTERTDANGNVITGKAYKRKTKDVLFPVVSAGVAVPLNKYSSFYRSGYYSLVVNTQFAFSQGEDLDGYDPLDAGGLPASKYNDMYNFTSIGLRYTF